MIAGILLTGGGSRRLGVDKATLGRGDRSLARHAADILLEHCSFAVEVGPGHSGLPAVRESPAGAGPLAAVATGVGALVLRGACTHAVLLACDLPNAAPVVEYLVTAPDAAAVVPVDAGGRRQYACARYRADALMTATALVAEGADSLRSWVDALPVGDVCEVVGLPEEWLWDLDTPADAARLGIELPR